MNKQGQSSEGDVALENVYLHKERVITVADGTIQTTQRTSHAKDGIQLSATEPGNVTM